ncbi:MAG: ABC transporter ATP-binding protein [Clostridiales bacterium]|nr:ABC transporter ATP-binding protein [Clostridiales bacterium]
MPLLTCQSLSLGYEGKTIIENLSFSVNSGDYLYIIGENGSGKSTLFKTVLRLIPPVSGRVITGDGLSDREIGYLPQQTMVQRDFPASVSEIVLSGCLNRCGIRPFYSKREREIAHLNMKKLGICDLAKRSYRELSGGQQQRVLLARALCATKKLLMLDEPAAGLDPKGKADLYQFIERLNSEDGITIIMISHDIEPAAKYASHILHIGGGGPLFFGTKKDYGASGLWKIYGCREGGDISWA